ncbi:Two-component system response regulator [Rubrivivax sp. A210]|uniref:response regulator transcription factor n=1 Tax=Rubrivivax sp. A210 TaxID=2772301 RepID=UPI001917CB0C|nr:response regulator [Rubrivivax sp. A210]CAD5373355.1 Two-component system response regulator [Rubrivivax sp. A210]
MEKILIVDDQAEIRRLLGISLHREYEVIEATDGASAMEMLRQHRPRAVLLDVMMPGEPDGLGVLVAIKSDPYHRHIPVAMLSARGQVADIEAARAYGADNYFTKPFSPLSVLAWLREALARSAPNTDFTQL